MSRLLERLRKCKDDRGIMANLRCMLVESKKHRAWPALNRVGVKVNDDVSSFIAGLFAVHPEESSSVNFGASCKSIERARGERATEDNKLTPIERRFQHLLVAERGAELRSRVLRMVLMAKAQGVPINYERLQTDLKFWSDRTKTEWAAAFWTPSVDPENEEAT